MSFGIFTNQVLISVWQLILLGIIIGVFVGLWFRLQSREWESKRRIDYNKREAIPIREKYHQYKKLSTPEATILIMDDFDIDPRSHSDEHINAIIYRTHTGD